MKILLTLIMLLLPGSALAAEALFNFNTATAAEMERHTRTEGCVLPKGLSEAIVQERSVNGPFRSIQDLARVPGMNDAILAMLVPVEEGGEVFFAPASGPVMKGY